MKRMLFKKSTDVLYSRLQEFFNAYNSTIYLEDDKDTYEEFYKIINSGNENCEFYLAYVIEDDRIISGALIMRINTANVSIDNVENICVIIYMFTLDDFRRMGKADYIVNYLLNCFDEAIWFCEVVEENKLSSDQKNKEKKYSGITCDERDKFWEKMNFHECQFDYYNPKPDLISSCNGSINYNNLLVNTKKEFLDKKIVLLFLKSYFKYGYCAGDVKKHEWEAYNMIASQIKSKINIIR